MLVVAVVAAFLVAWSLQRVLCQVSVVDSESMHPTLELGDRILVWKRLVRGIRRADVVVFRALPQPDGKSVSPSDDDGRWRSRRRQPELVKRVVGCPGDRIGFSTARVWIDDARVGSVARKPTPDSTCGVVTLRAGEFFVVGDNLTRSADSRHYGTVPMCAVVGRVVARIWPVHRMGRVEPDVRSKAPRDVEEFQG